MEAVRDVPRPVVRVQGGAGSRADAARARLLEHPTDDETLFLLGKLDLNYVWLQLGTLGRRTGWDEYWEARKSLDKVLDTNPEHVRARVARGWIDYIVDTKMPRGTRWLLGGGNKKRGCRRFARPPETEADFFTRDRGPLRTLGHAGPRTRHTGAIATADILVRDFPENQELKRFIGDSSPLRWRLSPARQHTPAMPRELTVS